MRALVSVYTNVALESIPARVKHLAILPNGNVCSTCHWSIRVYTTRASPHAVLPRLSRAKIRECDLSSGSGALSCCSNNNFAVAVACSTVTVTKCQAALHTLQAFTFFRPTCLCREPHVDPDCNSFQNFLFDHPCVYVHNKKGKKHTLLRYSPLIPQFYIADLSL